MKRRLQPALTLLTTLLAASLAAGCGGTLFANSATGGTGSGSGSSSGSGSGTGTVSTPGITGFTPSSIAAGSAAQTLTISGKDFESGASVIFNNDTDTTQFVSGTQLTVSLQATDLVAGGNVNVTLTNPDGGTTSTTFPVINPPPVVTALTPASLAAGSLPSAVTITGTGLNPSTTIDFGGVALPATYLGANKLGVLMTGSELATAAVSPVVATNPAPGGGASAPLNFVVTNPAPTIASFVPASLPQGAAPQAIMIDGTGFVNGSTVLWNGSGRSATWLGPTQLILNLTSGDLAQSGYQTVLVSNPAPGGGNSAAAQFAVNGPAPTLTAATPASAQVGTAQTISLTGTNFATGATVLFGTPAQTLTPTTMAPTQITVALPATALSAAGNYALAVSDPAPGGGTATLASGFSVVNPGVTLTSMLPVSAPLDDPNPVTVALGGSGFIAGVSSVLVNGTAATASQVNVLNSGQIVLMVPASELTQSGTFPIVVQNASPCAGSNCNSNPLYFSVGAPTSSPAGIAVVAEQVKQQAGGYQTLDVAYVPLAAVPGSTQAEIDVVQLDTIDLPPFLPINGLVTNASPYYTQGGAEFVNVPEIAPGTNGVAGTPVLNRILLPTGYSPSTAVADATDNQVLISSAQSATVYQISLTPDPASQAVSGSYSLAAAITAGPVEFSDYLCSGVCSLVVDQSGIAAHNITAGSAVHARGLAMTPSGVINIDAATGAVETPCLTTACGAEPGPDFGYASTSTNWDALNPYYLPDNSEGLQYMTLGGNGAVANLTNPIGTRPASAVIDPSTQLAVVTDEGTGLNTLLNLFQVTSSAPPFVGFYIGTGSTSCASRPDWTMAALDAGTHLLLSAQEFAGCLAVTQLPSGPATSSTGGAATPSAPVAGTQQKFGLVTAPQGPYTTSPPWGAITAGLDPDGNAWSNGYDPYKFAVYTSVLTGQPTALLLEPQLSASTVCGTSVPGVWMAETPLPAMLAASGASGIGEIAPSGMAELSTFLRLRTPLPAICGPATVAQGTTVTTVTITGAGFVAPTIGTFPGGIVNFSGTSLSWDGVAQIITALTPTSISFQLNPSLMAIGNHTVVVSESGRVYGSQGGTSTFTIQVVPASSSGI